MKTTKKYNIEYEEAPSGYVTFYNYKEPLMKFEGGFGYVGALVFDGSTDKIQCHFCGQWLGSLPHHLKREHNMTASQYKERVGLFQTTALISESARAKLIASGIDKRLANLRKGGRKSAEYRAKISKTLKGNGLKSEFANLRGTCPAQLIDRMQKIAKEKGDKLRMRDFDSFDELIRRTFGSMKEACKMANIKYNPVGSQYIIKERKYRKEDFINFAKEFLTRFDRYPTWTDFQKQDKSGLYDSVLKNHKYEDLKKEVYLNLDSYKKSEEIIRYTDEELLDFLRKFEKINARRPSYSDCKRDLLPHLSRYSSHFGTWKKALSLAFDK